MTNPCKDHKCIAYPICLNKREIECPQLNGYVGNLVSSSDIVTYIETKYNAIYEGKVLDFWANIHEFLPNLVCITDGDNRLYIKRTEMGSVARIKLRST